MRSSQPGVTLLLLIGASLTAGATLGCSGIPGRLRTPQRMQRGLVLVLPGIEGQSGWNCDIALGLDEGGVTSAIEVHDWTTRVPGGYVYNLTHLRRNRREAARLAERLQAYRRAYPGRPIHLVGHSAGAGVAVLALEALPADRTIEAAILLAPALSPKYDLTAALRRVSGAIYSFYSGRDFVLLRVGTSVFGSIDREHGPAAGAVGFETPDHPTLETRRLYRAGLRQVAWTPRLAQYGVDGTHLGWAAREFARRYLGPMIVQSEAAWSVQQASLPAAGER